MQKNETACDLKLWPITLIDNSAITTWEVLLYTLYMYKRNFLEQPKMKFQLAIIVLLSTAHVGLVLFSTINKCKCHYTLYRASFLCKLADARDNIDASLEAMQCDISGALSRLAYIWLLSDFTLLCCAVPRPSATIFINN